MLKKIANILFDQLGDGFLKSINRLGADNRVLLLKDDAFGDFLLFTGILDYYQTHYGKENVYLLVIDRIADVASLYVEKNRLIVLESKKYEHDLGYKKRFLDFLRKIGFKTVIASTHRSSNCNNIVKHLGATDRFGYEKELIFKSRRLNYYNHKVPSYDRLSPSRDKYSYNHVIDHERYFLSQVTNLGEVQRVKVMPFIPTDGFSRKVLANYFVLLPEAGDMIRAYAIPQLAAIMREVCQRYGLTCVVLGTGRGYDNSHFNSESSISLLGKTTLSEALAYIYFASFTLGNETGLTHASWIMNKPTVMIYGGGHYGRFLPLNSSCTLVTHKMDCYCCHWACRYDSPIVPCVSNISKETILAAIQARFVL